MIARLLAFLLRSRRRPIANPERLILGRAIRPAIITTLENRS